MSDICVGDTIKHKLGNVGIVKEIKIRGKFYGYVVAETKTGEEYWWSEKNVKPIKPQAVTE